MCFRFLYATPSCARSCAKRAWNAQRNFRGRPLRRSFGRACMNAKPRIAFILDALPAIGGGEKTLFAALEVFPQADIFTLVYNRPAFVNSPIANKNIITSVLDQFPFARTRHRLLLPLMPFVIERFDLCQYDVVVAFSYAVA